MKTGFKLILGLLFIVMFSSFVSADKVLIIGDSHTAGVFGTELHNALKAQGNEVNSYGCVGASASSYAAGGFHCVGPNLGSTKDAVVSDYYLSSISSLISQHKPSRIIVALGANYLSHPEQTQTLINLLPGLPCYWVGPPHSPSVTELEMDLFYTQLSKIVSGKCTLIDSRRITQYPFCDVYPCSVDQHFNSGDKVIIARSWAQEVVNQVGQGGFSTNTLGARGSTLAAPTGSITSGGVSTFGGTSSASGYANTNNEIDQVWTSISSLIGSRYAGQVWDPSSGWHSAGSGTVTSTTLPLAGNSGNYCGGTVSNAGSVEMRALLDTIAWAEGANYNTIVGGETFTDFSTHPKKRVYIPRIKDYSTAAGRYQFLGSTYETLKRDRLAFLNGFYPKDQDEAAIYSITIKRGASNTDLLNAISSNNFVPLWDKLALEWASIPISSTGTSYYGQGGRSVSQLDAKFKECYEIQKAKG